MPQQVDFVNGKVVITGDDTAQDHIPLPDAPAAPAPKPKPKPKPKGKAAPAKPWWQGFTHAVANEAKFVGKTIQSLEATQKGGPVKPGLMGLVDAVSPIGGALRQAGRYSPTVRQVTAAATYGAAQTAGEGLIAIGQHMFKGSKFADPKGSRPGRLLNAVTRAGYAATGAKQPEDLTEPQRGIIDIQARSLGVEAGTAALVPPVKLFQGAGMVSRGLRLGTRMGVAHGLSSFTQDSTLGNMSNMAEAVTGQKVPGAVDPLTDDRVTAGMKSIIPNMVGGEVLGLGITAGARALGKAGNVFPNIARQKRALRGNTEHTTANERVKATGLVEDVDGRQQFTEAGRAKPAPLPLTVDERTQQILDRFGPPSKPAAPAAAPPAQATPASTAGQGFAPTTVRFDGPNVRWRDLWQESAQGPTFMATGPDKKWRDSFAADGQPVIVRSTGPNQPWREGPRVDDGLDVPAPMPDDPAYQDWLRRNASNALVPITPPDSGLDMLPKRPLAPQDAMRGEDLVDPWGIGPDPNSPVQRALGAAEQSPPPEIDPTQEFFDNGDLPEIADVQKMLDDLDDDELAAVAIAGADGGPVLQHLNDAVATRPTPQPRFEVSEDAAGMPTASLSELYLNGAGDLEPWIKQFNKIPLTTLLELAHPEASPRLFGLIHAATGRDWDAFTRADIIGGIQKLSAQGTTILPNRLRGDATLTPMGQVVARPKEFQYKENVNAKGEQMGHSLGGVDKWNPNLEGVVDVFTDPKTGEIVVVNGHNRRALAERLGVPSLITREVDATTPAAARAEGAMANIAAGAGTPFDAAKFIKATGLRDSAQLDAAGIPTDKGYGRQGLALSRLPAEIFQDAVNETHDLGRFLDLGASGLDEAGMRGAYQVLQQRPKMSAGAFREIIELGPDLGSVVVKPQDGQGKFPGFEEEVLAPMIVRAELVADVRRALGKEKRVFGSAIKNADAFEGAGVASVDAAAAGARVADASQALAMFDTLKSVKGPMADTLNEGAKRIASGEKADVVTKQVQKEVINSIEQVLNEAGIKTPGRPGAPAPATPDLPAAITPEVLPPVSRADLERHALQRAIANGEVRPTETGLVEVPEGLGSDWGDMQHEQALGAEFYSQDTLMRHEAVKAMREAQGYDLMTWEEKQQTGATDWLGPVDGDDRDTLEIMGSALYHMKEHGKFLDRMNDELSELIASIPPDADELFLNPANALPPGTPKALPPGASKALPPGASKALPPAPDATTPEIVQPAPKDSISGVMRDVIDKMKTSDVKSFSILANQLFESSWVLERNKKWKGMTKDEARAAYIQEFGERMQEGQNALRESASSGGEGKPKKLSETLKDLTDRMKASDDRLKELGEQTFGLRRQVMDLELGPDLGDVGELPPAAKKALIASEVSNAPPFVLPSGLNKAPRHGSKELKFESDLDLTAYMLASDRTKGESKAAQKYREALAAAGFNVDQVVAHGALVKKAVKQGVKETDDGTAVIPVQPFGGDNPRLPLPEQARQAAKAQQRITDLKDQINKGGCGL